METKAIITTPPENLNCLIFGRKTGQLFCTRGGICSQYNGYIGRNIVTRNGISSCEECPGPDKPVVPGTNKPNPTPMV